MITLMLLALSVITIIAVIANVVLLVSGLLTFWPLALVATILIAIDCVTIALITKMIKKKRASK